MKPWIENDEWFEKYARGSFAVKVPRSRVSEALPEQLAAIEDAFKKVYRAVAFDIDGTLTEKEGDKIDQHMAIVVGRLLKRGVPVILITGRGRAWSRKAAQEIKLYSGLSDWYLRRLQCITHNGVFLLQSPVHNPERFLSQETLIAPKLDDIRNLVRVVREVINENVEQLTGLDNIELSLEPQSVRLIFKFAQDRARIEIALQALVTRLNESGTAIYLSRGSYTGFSCLDLAGTTKKQALEHVAELLGVGADRILRIGDQGQEGGNDFDLLDSAVGFSVGELSSSLTRCHPVLDLDLHTQLRGASATERLLKLVLLFPPLSIIGTRLEERLQSLRSFERLAIARSREETETVTQQLRVRVRYLLPEGDEYINPHTLEIDDIYDQRSGAIKFRDWELDGLSPDHAVLRLFDVMSLDSAPQQSGSSWCMYTDTGILMRGPNYYFGMTMPNNERTIFRYLKLTEDFIRAALVAVNLLSQEKVDLTRFKLVLAIQDNIRNILLQVLYAAFMTEGRLSPNTYIITRQVYKEAVLPHTKHHLDFLLNANADWSTSLSSYQRLLSEVEILMHRLRRSLVSASEKVNAEINLFKWRECDHFLQNLTAVQLGLHELRQHQDILNVKRLVAVGLTYGGIELPAIAQAVAQVRSFNLEAAFAQISIYEDRKVRQTIRAGEHNYIADLLNETKPLCMVDSIDNQMDDATFVIMDDNCTTCITLQFARDFLVMQRADVVGAIAVRFPGINRRVQMAMPGHGFCDPEILFSFIRGLVAPSPYARLIYPQEGSNPYLDQTNIFDKAKDRIVRYLQKNRTPIWKEEHNE